MFYFLLPSLSCYRSLQLLQKSCGRRAATMILRLRAHWHRCNCTAALNIRSGAIRHGLRKVAKTFCRHGELFHRDRTTIWWVLGFWGGLSWLLWTLIRKTNRKISFLYFSPRDSTGGLGVKMVEYVLGGSPTNKESPLAALDSRLAKIKFEDVSF